MSETKIVAIPTHIAASTDKDGRKRPAHISTRHRAVPVTDEPTGDNATALDGWIAKHGGAEHLRKTLDEMTADQRAKLLDAMAHVDGITPAEVMKKLGIHEPKASEDEAAIADAIVQFRARMAQARDESVITTEEYDAVLTTLEEDGLEYAIEQLRELRAPASEHPPEPPVAADPASLVTAKERASEGAAGIRAALQAQADEIYQRHVAATNQAVRADFEVEKREIRGWKIPQAMRDEATRCHAEAERALQQWQAFCHEHGLEGGLS